LRHVHGVFLEQFRLLEEVGVGKLTRLTPLVGIHVAVDGVVGLCVPLLHPLPLNLNVGAHLIRHRLTQNLVPLICPRTVSLEIMAVAGVHNVAVLVLRAFLQSGLNAESGVAVGLPHAPGYLVGDLHEVHVGPGLRTTVGFLSGTEGGGVSAPLGISRTDGIRGTLDDRTRLEQRTSCAGGQLGKHGSRSRSRLSSGQSRAGRHASFESHGDKSRRISERKHEASGTSYLIGVFPETNHFARYSGPAPVDRAVLVAGQPEEVRQLAADFLNDALPRLLVATHLHGGRETGVGVFGVELVLTHVLFGRVLAYFPNIKGATDAEDDVPCLPTHLVDLFQRVAALDQLPHTFSTRHTG